MTQLRILAALAIAALVATVPAAAQGKSGAHGGGATATHGKPTTTGVATHGNSGDATHGNTGDATHGKSGDATHGHSADAVHGKDGDQETETESTPHDGRAPHAPRGPSSIATKINGNPEQLARITAMLPAGMTLDQATAGFRNQGQFIAALNASKNQGVPFADLQKAMTVDGLSLGQAVKKLRPTPTPTPTQTGTTTGDSSTKS
jgi:hypothetical protein